MYPIAFNLALVFWAAVTAADPVFNHVRSQPQAPERYGLFEVTIDLSATFDNPFDPAQIKVGAHFTAPSGAVHAIDGFYYQDFSSGNGSAPVWKIRFAPSEVGRWSYTLEATDRDGQTDHSGDPFVCQATANPGFIRRSGGPTLHFDDGTPYWALGQNMGWGDFANPLADYQTWMEALAAHRGNYIRLWMPSWGFALEWNDTGLGDYRQRLHRAWQLDQVVDRARDLGLYIQLVLNNHGQLSTRTNPEWANNPYNAANGGPCAQPWDFFTDPSAADFFVRRLRYIAARWGFSSHILAWELFNEVDLVDGFEQNQAAIAQWHERMGNTLDQLDPNRHLVTSSLSGGVTDAFLWRLDSIDLVQLHHYTPGADAQSVQFDLTQTLLSQFGKPVMIGEFCFTDPNLARRNDPGGVYLHNTLWATTFSGAFGAAAIWWWDNYIDPLNLYHHYGPLATFSASIEEPSSLKSVKIPVQAATAADLVLNPALGFEKALANQITVSPQGEVVPSAALLSSYLFGTNWNTQLRNPPTFSVDFPQAGHFVVETGRQSSTAPRLVLWLDGEKVLDQPALTEQRYAIEVSAGPHQITVENRGTDWIRLAGYRLVGYVPAARSFALQGTDQLWGWVQNRAYNWQTLNQNGPPTAIETATLRITGLPFGTYTAQWHTTTGQELTQTTARTQAGQLHIPIPSLTWDLSYHISPTADTPSPTAAYDFNGDQQVDLSDFFLFADHFGRSPADPNWDPKFDTDSSGQVDLIDFFAFADHFGLHL